MTCLHVFAIRLYLWASEWKQNFTYGISDKLTDKDAREAINVGILAFLERQIWTPLSPNVIFSPTKHDVVA